MAGKKKEGGTAASKLDNISASKHVVAGQRSLTSFFGVSAGSATAASTIDAKKGGDDDDDDDGPPPMPPAVKPKKTIDNGGNFANEDDVDDDDDDDAMISPGKKENVANDKGVTRKETTAVKKRKRKNVNDEGNDGLMDTDEEEEDHDEEELVKKLKGVKETNKIAYASSSSTNSKKRVIEDDNDSEEEEEEEADEEDEEAEEDVILESKGWISVDRDEYKEMITSAAAASATKAKQQKNSKKQKTLEGKDAVAPPPKKMSSSTAATKKSETIANNMKSNKQLLNIMATQIDPNDATTNSTTATTVTDEVLLWIPYSKPAPYSALCDVFTDIESISGRLEIQERLTTLFRTVLLRDGGGTGVDDNEGVGNEKKTGGETKSAAGDKDGSKGETTKKQPQQVVMSDLLTLAYLTSNTVAPQHENVELGVGDSILIKAIGEASGTSNDMIKKKYDKEGDLGNVAMNAKGKQRTLVGFSTKKVGLGGGSGPKRLSCVDVLRVFKEIANVSGSQSQKWKVDKIKSLLVRAKGYESKYIIRGLQGKLRIGLAQSTVLASLAHAIVLTKPCDVTCLTEEQKRAIRKLDGTPNAYPESARRLCTTNPEPPLDIQLEAATAIVKKAYNEVPSYDSLLAALLCTPLQELHKHCTLTPGVPVGPMLAKPTKSIKEVLKRLDGKRFTLEYKYDGERAQVHLLSNGEMRAFSRSLLDSSEKFPEVPLYCRESCAASGVTDFVLDTEVVAYNTETGQFLPFQVLSTRKRTGESADSSKIRVIVQAFDLMYLNGTSLLDKTLSERRELMKKSFLPIDGKFQYATSMDHKEDGDTAVIEEFLDAAIKGQCEGLMVKTLDDNAAYEPSRRSLNWLKLKKDYLDGLGDSVDLVPLGACKYVICFVFL